MPTPAQAGFAILVLGVALIIGKIIRLKARWAQKLFLPSSIIGGFILLFLGPGLLGNIFGGRFADAGIFTPQILAAWRPLPGLLISVVFATMFLGMKLPSPRRTARVVGPQLALGFAYGSGQYVLGIALTFLPVIGLISLFNAHPTVASLIEIGFEGGHGTAAGMRPVFDNLGFAPGGDLAVAVATIGLLSGIILGIAFINWGVRTGKTEVITGNATISIDEQRGLFRKDEHYQAGRLTSRPSSVEPMSLHVAVVCLAVLFGWLMLEGLRWIETVTWGRVLLQDGVPLELFRYVPLFPMALLGGVLVQKLAEWTGFDSMIDHQMMLRVQGLALDFLIVSAIGSMSLGAIAAHWQIFAILSIAGIIYCVLIFRFLTPALIGRFWFERGIADFGQSTGVTATGLILMRIVDPQLQTPAFEAFGMKQLFFEPFYGGGLITALSLPLIYFFGPWPFFIFNAVVFVFSIVWGIYKFGPTARREHAERRAGVPAQWNGQYIHPQDAADVAVATEAADLRERVLVGAGAPLDELD